MTQGLLRDEAGVRLEPRSEAWSQVGGSSQVSARGKRNLGDSRLSGRAALGSGHLIDKFKEDAGGKSLKNDKNDSSQWSQVT